VTTRDFDFAPGVSADGRQGWEAPVTVPSRARRLFSGWSANIFQMILGVAQQVALVPVFLHFWTSEVLAAWFVIYAAGNLVLIADVGLQFRAINRFLVFKSSVDCDGRTACFYAEMMRIYKGLAASIAALLIVGAWVFPPARLLGFQPIPDFDAAFNLMAAGMLLTLPSNLVSGLYRARGLYGRVVSLQNWGMLVAQLGQLVVIIATGSLLAVTIVYVSTQILTAIYFLVIDVPRLFPFLRSARARNSWPWIVGQFRKAAPFAVASGTELALLNAPVLLVSAFVIDRVAVAQWALTRVVAGLLRLLSFQTALPLAAELGHDYAVGLKNELRNLYARGSVLVTLQASVVTSGLLPFWPDFFALWTRGAIPYDSSLAITLLIGTGVIAPSILALSYANYSDRGNLLVRSKGLQLVAFLLLSGLLIPQMGPLGAAIALVASDTLIQFGVLGLIIIGQTLKRPVRHVAFLAALMIIVTLGGWALGVVIRSWLPGTGLMRFVAECTLWLIVVACLASPLLRADFRNRLIAAIPR
jgi:O-antigen/teichoic acid export membrane protein